jgi:hypothetical protein
MTEDAIYDFVRVVICPILFWIISKSYLGLLDVKIFKYLKYLLCGRAWSGEIDVKARTIC